MLGCALKSEGVHARRRRERGSRAQHVLEWVFGGVAICTDRRSWPRLGPVVETGNAVTGVAQTGSDVVIGTAPLATARYGSAWG